MKILDLIQDLSPLSTFGDLLIEIRSVVVDSRRVSDESAFVAVRGASADGHQYIPKAIEAGARLIVAERLPIERKPEVCYVQVANSHLALGLMSATLYGHPSRQMKVVGITGTNGKTTTATLLYRLFRAVGYRVGLLSTVCNYINDQSFPSTHTTPDAPELQKLLADMLADGCQYVFMEVSSHATEQQRIAGIEFDGAIFSNLTRDHLDYHGSMQEYIRAKKSFFDGLSPTAFALINTDDKNGVMMLQNCTAQHYTYALQRRANFQAKVLEEYADSTEVEFDGSILTLQLVGRFNVYNSLAVYGCARLLGISKDDILRYLSALTAVDGRFQTIQTRHGFTVVVDYAHTPDAIASVLDTITHLLKPHSSIIAVVGAGGDRDHGKRPIMAIETAKRAHKVILTADNPRSERPEDIIEEMYTGLDSEARSRTLCITDRRQAIRTACMMASGSDFVLVAGKGHETYQEINGIKHPFDDREEVRQATEAI